MDLFFSVIAHVESHNTVKKIKYLENALYANSLNNSYLQLKFI